jgi:hypothetical protein
MPFTDSSGCYSYEILLATVEIALDEQNYKTKMMKSVNIIE